MIMKKTFTSILFFLFIINLNAQCVLDMTVSVDGTGNFVTTNNSTGADPSSYIWYVYNTDMNPWTAEYLESANTIIYAPLYVGNYLVCLVATENGTNNACDSLCEPLTYSQSMMNMQNSSGIEELMNTNEVTVYPIPTHDILYVIESKITQETEFKVFDLLGYIYKVESSVNNQVIEIDVSLLPNGVYFINVENRGQILRFVVD